MKKKVLVCGSTGFIGRNVAETLSQIEEYEVYGTHFTRPPLDNNNIHSIRTDLRVPHQVEAALRGKDIVIQAAATTSGAKDIVHNPYFHVTDNAIMNSLILRSIYDHSIPHFIFFSCSVMYPPLEDPVKESDFNASKELHPRYQGVGWTKVYIEKMCEFYAGLGRTKHMAIRHSNIYGPYDKFDLEKSHVFGASIRKIMTTTDNRINVWGKGKESRDFLFVDDLVNFVSTAIQRQTKQFELINVGSGYAVSVENLVRTIASCAEKNVTLNFDLDKPSIDTSLCLDISKAKEIFDWKPRVPLQRGIRRTLAWYKTNIGPEKR